MVKHAADEQLPLLNAPERVAHAIESIKKAHKFTPEQLEWLDRIHAHLQTNLCIDLEDLETQPIFTQYGGRSKAFVVFQGQLPFVIQEINKAIAA